VATSDTTHVASANSAYSFVMQNLDANGWLQNTVNPYTFWTPTNTSAGQYSAGEYCINKKKKFASMSDSVSRGSSIRTSYACCLERLHTFGQLTYIFNYSNSLAFNVTMEMRRIIIIFALTYCRPVVHIRQSGESLVKRCQEGTFPSAIMF
jgi:hypothetical protein